MKNSTMNKKILLTICIIVGVILLALAFYIGTYFSPNLSSGGNIMSVVESINSPVISTITAYGTVQKIQGQTITLSADGDTRDIQIQEGSTVSILITQTSGQTSLTGPKQSTANFSMIKVGDKLNIQVKLLPTGELSGTGIIILPASFTK